VAGDAAADSVVRGAGVELAVRDHGGDGAPILLVHGAFRTLADWNLIVPRLLPGHRVVALELRGHGRSGAGRWSWDDVVADVAAVIDSFGLEAPTIAGHSLGGMIATLCAGRFVDDCRAVNLDGGFADVETASAWTTAALAAPWLEQMDRELARDELSDAVATTFASLVRPPEIAGEAFERALVQLPDGRYATRPSRADAAAVLTAVGQLDLGAAIAAARHPLLLCLAVGDTSMDATAERTSSFARLVDRQPLARLETVRASHDLIVDEPAAVAASIARFADS
jgi:pimeloyl-ACP methyl ester carboxylesterase